jgi:glutathione peroxidase
MVEMKNLVLVLVAVVLAGGVIAAFVVRSTLGGDIQTAPEPVGPQRLYDLSSRTLDGDAVELSEWEGRVALVVNLASKCGLTPQYEGLEALHREFGSKGFTVLGFPSNDFMNQEPGSAAEIRDFCSSTYGVSFPLFEKVQVKGEQKNAVYAFLTRDLEEPTWNFTKYLVGRDGKVLFRFSPRTTPDDPELRQRIEEALAS